MSFSNPSAVSEVPAAVRAANAFADAVVESKSVVNRFLGAVRRERLRRETRRQLFALSDRALADIGLTRDSIPQVVDSLVAR